MLLLQCSRRTLLSSSSTTVVRKTERRREDVFLNISAQVPRFSFQTSPFFASGKRSQKKEFLSLFLFSRLSPGSAPAALSFLSLSLSLSLSQHFTLPVLVITILLHASSLSPSLAFYFYWSISFPRPLSSPFSLYGPLFSFLRQPSL